MITIVAMLFSVQSDAKSYAVLPKATRTPTIQVSPTYTITPSPTSTKTSTPTPTPTSTNTSTITSTVEATLTEEHQHETQTATEIPSTTPTSFVEITPFFGATQCPDIIHSDSHDTNEFHTIWDSIRGCHYDHEHGTNPFTEEVAQALPVFDIVSLQCGQEIGHCNPSSPMENTHKHSGFKWDVALDVPCETFENSEFCAKNIAIQYHGFGNYFEEMKARKHSTSVFAQVCRLDNENDCGWFYTISLQDYGQRVSQYQGSLMPYPDSPEPAFEVGKGPYFTVDRIGSCLGCRESIEYIVSRKMNSNTTWTSKCTQTVPACQGFNKLFNLLWRGRDVPRIPVWISNELQFGSFPFSFQWICGGDVFNPEGCRYTNTTTKVHEVRGVIPIIWDNLAEFDTNPEVGRISANGFVDSDGNINFHCEEAGDGCYPIKLIDMFVGKWGSALPGSKVSNMTVTSNPSRNIWFCGTTVCAETSIEGVPSSWIGNEN